MPEGPEVRIQADKIEKAVAGKPLESFQLLYGPIIIKQEQFQSVCLTHIETFGKAFVLHFSNDLCIYVHLQLYGRWQTGRIRSRKPSRRALRIRLETETHYADLYSATDISIHQKGEVQDHPFLKKLGLDILHPQTSIESISAHLESKSSSRRSLGALLLDQGSFAGIGNYLRAEILFRAGLLHNRTLSSLSNGERTSLAKMIYDTTHRAYKTRGITLDDEYVQIAKRKGWRRPRYRHFTFARLGKNCWVCQEPIEKSTSAGRRIYWCPSCQV